MCILFLNRHLFERQRDRQKDGDRERKVPITGSIPPLPHAHSHQDWIRPKEPGTQLQSPTQTVEGQVFEPLIAAFQGVHRKKLESRAAAGLKLSHFNVGYEHPTWYLRNCTKDPLHHAH